MNNLTRNPDNSRFNTKVLNMAVEAAVVFNNNHCSINTNTQQGEEEKVHMDLNRIKAAQAVEAA